MARQFPITFTDVRAMSISSSMPRMARIGHSGSPKEAAVPSRITRVARGTPATPLLVSMSVNTITSCWPKESGMPAAWATKIEARDR